MFVFLQHCVVSLQNEKYAHHQKVNRTSFLFQDLQYIILLTNARQQIFTDMKLYIRNNILFCPNPKSPAWKKESNAGYFWLDFGRVGIFLFLPGTGIMCDDVTEPQSLGSLPNIPKLNSIFLRSACVVKVHVLLAAIHPSDGGH